MSEPPGDFKARTHTLLDERAAAHRAESLDATFRALAPRRFGWPALAAVGLAAAAATALVTWSLAGSADPAPAAFDGGLTAAPPADPSVKRDARGRISEIAVDGAVDGERLLFRAGRLLRVEHWREGRLDGVVIDLDGSGRVVRVETWSRGERVGPNLELDPTLAPRVPAP
ncbi:MAG: hypothetical protein IT385_10610 [Deltaproteobacteria bacterium]|nr:hypothetical protein [Deltaproteobacteria bacterium]